MLQLVACKILGNCLDVIGCGGRRVAIEGKARSSFRTAIASAT
jgi:hypothetical protein